MKNRTSSNPTDIDAARLQAAIRSTRDFRHVVVRAQRGHLVVFSGDDDAPVARLTPCGGGRFGLSFHQHTGRWQSMPFAGGLDEMAATVTTVLAPHLERWDFHRDISGSDN